MNKKKYYFITSIIVLVILIISGVITKINNVKDNIFTTEKLNTNSSVYKKINDKVSGVIEKNGIYLLNTGEDNVTYLILDGSHLSFKNEIPCFSDIKIENKGASILIYFSEELKTYSEGKYTELRLIYKITEDKDTEYIRVFKNGEETHIDSVIGS